MHAEKVGITIITGFLGAGKTSLLNQIISKEDERKFAIIENEFSEFGIDAEIIKGIENSNIIELSNGCICCTMNTELQETLDELLNSSLKFDHLIIETTGMAEPDSVVQSVVANVKLKEVFYIDSVICLVDAVNFNSNIKKIEAIKQIAMADTVLINKTENISEQSHNEIADQLKALNPFCELIPTIYSDYKENKIIDCKTFSEDNFKKAFQSQRPNEKLHLSVDIPIKTISIELEGSFKEEKFKYWIEYFLLLNQSSIYRAKGIISFENNSRKLIFQSVKAAFSIEEGGFWNIDETRKCNLIFIGHELNKNEIVEGLTSLMHD
jgi:G3E family GTPase